jgi:hypothetical protein
MAKYLGIEELAQIAVRRAKANAELQMLCSGEKRFLMSIPVREEDDSDMIIGNTLHDTERLINEIYRLRGCIKVLYVNSFGKLPEEMREVLQDLIFDEFTPEQFKERLGQETKAQGDEQTIP